jgi:hypothetical protein
MALSNQRTMFDCENYLYFSFDGIVGSILWEVQLRFA